MLHLILCLHLLIVVLLLLVGYNWLVRLEVFPNSLIYSLLSNFVIISGLDLDHVFQIIYIVCIELGILGVGTPTSELLMYIDPSISLSFSRDL